MSKVNIDLLPAQGEFCMSEYPYPAISGGLGSGKSSAATIRLITKMISDTGINTLYGMPTYDLLKLRAMPGVEDDLQRMGFDYRVNKSDYYIEIMGYGKIYFRSYDRPQRWVAFEVAHTILDELDTLKLNDAELVWRKATERTRQKCKDDVINTIGVVTTPDMGVNGFVCKRWGGNDNTALEDGFHLIFADTRDNFHNPKGYYEQIMSNYDPLLAEMYTQGKFVSLTRNKVYHYFNRERHHSDRVITDADKVLHVSIDFNVGGCCSNAFIIENNEPVAVDEFTSHDTAEFISNLNDRYDGKKVIVYPDASGGNSATNASASDIGIIEQAGLQCDAPKKNPFIRDRVNSVNSLLAKNKFKLNTDKCPMLTLALESQGYDDKGDPEKFHQHPAIDDWLDAMGYFIHRRYAINKDVLVTNIGMVQ